LASSSDRKKKKVLWLETWTSWRLQWQLLPASGDFEKIQSEKGNERDRTRDGLLKGTAPYI
jgi:hypothetical protein